MSSKLIARLLLCLSTLLISGRIASSSDLIDKKDSSAIEREAARSFSGDLDSIRERGTKFLIEHDGNPAAARMINAICERDKQRYPHFSWGSIESPRVWLVIGRTCLRSVKEPEVTKLVTELRILSLGFLESGTSSDRAEAAITLGAVSQPKDFELLRKLASSHDDQAAIGAVIALHLMGQRLNYDYLADAMSSIKNKRARDTSAEIRRQISPK